MSRTLSGDAKLATSNETSRLRLDGITVRSTALIFMPSNPSSDGGLRAKADNHPPESEKINLNVIATNERAIGLYKKFGFQEEGRRFSDLRYSPLDQPVSGQHSHAEFAHMSDALSRSRSHTIPSFRQYTWTE